MSALDKEPFPKGALIAASALIGFSLIATGAVRLARLSAPSDVAATPQAAPVRSVEVRFFDETDGSVSVRESRSNQVVTSLAPGTNGFVRSVMRGLVHDRKRRGLGADAPFRISQWAGGRLALEDPATGRLIDLDAFGNTNKDAFAQMLPGRQAAS
ncbi:photosynthetic complex assembly protein PuhC [Phenylobacterium sp.]|uniref:photosynthetic complex assembly protein PuhC n=1 Tax=Phenylobacterium sp. TaxID=1871053 RepID=UPI0025F370C6|nr:photosynthetic complex assembly protein PuhC [Phenylobacterium sp.]